MNKLTEFITLEVTKDLAEYLRAKSPEDKNFSSHWGSIFETLLADDFDRIQEIYKYRD